MGKCVLVMDMPSSCDMCRLASLVGREEVMCAVDRMATRKYADACKDKPDWCPLRNLPKKKVLSGDVADIQKMGKELIDIGYNACIDELLKEE